MGNALYFFLRMSFGAVLIAAWSSAFDYFYDNDLVGWFVHIMMSYVIVSAGAILSFFVSLAGDVRRA